MKILNKFNDVSVKVMKGMFALFTIKLTILLVSFTFQTCSTDGETQNPNNEEFMNSVEISVHNVNSIPLTNGAFGRLDGSTKTVYLTKDPNQNFDDTDFLNSIQNVEGLVNISNQYNLELSVSIESNEEILDTYTIPEQPVIDALQPSIKNAKSYLYSLGLTDVEIENELQGSEDSNLVLVVMSLIDAENKNNSTTAFNYNDLFGQSVYAMATPQDWYDCLLRSVGIDAVVELFNGKVTKEIAKKAIRKVASRTLGWIGVAIAVYEYGDCMGWY
tara:strand:+ start:44811 stop:45632 length:822 start_codon:yes stop_codon:yes gene_type:complete